MLRPGGGLVLLRRGQTGGEAVDGEGLGLMTGVV